MKPLFKLGSERHDKGRVIFSWHPKGNFLASVGKNATIYITDRHGYIEEEINLKKSHGAILSLEWDNEGEYLAISQEGNGTLFLWHSTKRILSEVDTGYKDLSIIIWSKMGPQLAVGTSKGNLFLYNKVTKKNLSIMGKHARKITSGAWSSDGNYLALGSDDCTLSISKENGDTVLETEGRFAPVESSFVRLCKDDSSHEDGLACNLDGKLLFLFNFHDEKEAPIELAFGCNEGESTCKYGQIRRHQSLGDDTLLVGFSLGYLLTVAISGGELGQERGVKRFFSSNMSTFAYNPASQLVAAAGDDGIRFITVPDLKERDSEHISLDQIEHGKVQSLAWSPDGQMLTVATNAGNVYCFLAKSNCLHSSSHSQVTFLSSLQEATVIDYANSASEPLSIALNIEPVSLSVGDGYLVACAEKELYIYPLTHRAGALDDSVDISSEFEFSARIADVKSNTSYLAVLLDNAKFQVQSIVSADKKNMTFPNKNGDSGHAVTCIALTKSHLYFGTDTGSVMLFALDDWCLVPDTKCQLDRSIQGVYPSVLGTRAVVVDADCQIYLYSPVAAQSMIQLKSAPTEVVTILWDQVEKNVIVVFDGKYLHTYLYVPTSYTGSYVVKLGPVIISTEGSVLMEPSKFELPIGYRPLVSRSGRITCVTSSGVLVEVVHPYFDQLGPDRVSESDRLARLDPDDADDQAMLLRRFAQAIGLLRLDVAWEAALLLHRRELWLALSGKAIETLNVSLAIRVYRQVHDAGMVMSLQSIVAIEDRLLLSGHIALLFNDYDRAQELFLKSSDPAAALRLRCDLLQWEQAYKLAKALASPQLCDVTARYALQLEHSAEYDTALKLFESCLEVHTIGGNSLPACTGDMRVLVESGVCRCELRLGNLRKGINLALEIGKTILFQECGDILEQQKQYTEAADFHVKAHDFERAAYIYTKHIVKTDPSRIREAAAVLEKVRNDQLNIAFAKLSLAAGEYKYAVDAYTRANDLEKVVEIKLRHLDQSHVQEAFDLVRRHPTDTCTALIADYCNQMSNFRGMVEFYLLANRFDEAFRVAQSHNLVDLYASCQGEHIGPEEAIRVAQYYEKSQVYRKAGRFYALAAQYQRALKLFFQCGNDAIDDAIDVVGKSESETLTHQIIDFLTGEMDGVPKDTNFIYKLYVALKRYEEAANTALVIASNEQELGNYTVAHAAIFEAMRYLEEAHVKIPHAMRQMFILLHSYLLVKTLVRRGNHVGAARLLLRVTQNLSKFPKHTVPILTSAVIECQRAGMKASCYDFASTLMRPEYRSLMNPELKRKVEAIVRRKTSQNEEAEEGSSPCPITGSPVPDYLLECPTTRDALPMCVVTGKHMVIDDWCICPNSGLPALYSEYIEFINFQLAKTNPSNDEDSADAEMQSNTNARKIEAADPVLGKPVALASIRKSPQDEAKKYIRWYNNILDETENESEEPTSAVEESNNYGARSGDAESGADDDQFDDGDSGGSGDELELMKSSKSGPGPGHKTRRHSRSKRVNKNSTRFRAARARRASRAK